MARVTLDEFSEVLQASWSAETSDDVQWSPENPALGQAVVSSLVTSDYLGGDVVRGKALLPSGTVLTHYFNSFRCEDELTAIDMTGDQFPKGTIVVRDRRVNITDDGFCFSDKDVDLFHRYVALRTSVAAGLLALKQQGKLRDQTE